MGDPNTCRVTVMVAFRDTREGRGRRTITHRSQAEVSQAQEQTVIRFPFIFIVLKWD